MTRPSRLVSITYGGLTIGAGSSYDLHAVHSIRESYTEFELEATVVFRAATSTAAQVLDAAFRTAFSKPDQSDFDLTIDSVSWLALSHAADTWLNPRAEFETIEEFRSLRSRGYRIRIRADLPADLAGRAARRSSRVDVDRDQGGNLHLTISADYTSSGGTTAYDQAIASFPAYVTTVQTAVGGGTWLPQARNQVSYDDQNKLATISASFVQDRILTIAYGGLTIGTGTAYDLREIQEISETYERQELVFLVTFDAASTAAAQTLDAALRAAYSKPDQDLTVNLNSVTWLSLSHSGQTGFNSRAQIEPLPEYFSVLSYGYRIRIVAALPADLAGRAGRQDSRWTTATLPTGQKALEVQATYTALASVGTALVTAQADFAAFVASLQTIVGGAWVEAQAVEITLDDQDKVARARAEYQQRLIDDSAAGASDPDFEVRGYTVTVDRPEVSVAIGTGARPLARATVSFGADVQTSASTASTYVNKILPYLSTLITSQSDLTGSPRVASERIEYDPWRSVVQGSVVFVVAQASLLAASRRIRGRENSGTTLVAMLDRDKPFAKARFDGPRSKTRTVEIVTLELFGGTQHEVLVKSAEFDATSAGYVWIDTETVEAETEIPTVRGNPRQLIERASILTFEFGGAAGASGAGLGAGSRRTRVRRTIPLGFS